jgi:hypothetical protein
LQTLQNPDEGTQGSHLPQEKKMEVPQVREGEDAEPKAGLVVCGMLFAICFHTRDGSL